MLPKMSIRWRIAALILAAVAFVGTLTGQPVYMADWPPLVSATVAAVSIAIWVWLMEAVVSTVRWTWQKLWKLSN